jgi:hypothetical protein
MALIRVETVEFVELHLRQVVEVGVRVRLQETGPHQAELEQDKETASDLLDLLEKHVGSPLFIATFADVQKKLQTNRTEWKHKLAVEAVSNPRAFAQRKVTRI